MCLPPFRPVGSSPHTRGAHQVAYTWDMDLGIIPAYAGSTLPSSWRARSGRDHPRIRGEHSKPSRGCNVDGGSSPHTRGAPPPSGIPRRPSRIIPAYAGSTRTQCTAPRAIRDHPRIRGEHYLPKEADIFEGGSSPHTRGAQIVQEMRDSSQRIIPAYAGSTTTPSAPPPDSGGSSPHTRGARDAGVEVLGGAQDHPRIRGEHVPVSVTPVSRCGSSPHTRGAPYRRRHRRLSQRIIPAYAGSTGCAR